MFTHKTWTSSLGTSNTLTIIENILEMRKLQPPKVKGVKNSKNQTTKHYKGRFSNIKFLFIYFNVALFLLESKDDLYNFRWHSYNR
jgi:hypothetical protein